jgi:hypothetical protein
VFEGVLLGEFDGVCETLGVLDGVLLGEFEGVLDGV